MEDIWLKLQNNVKEPPKAHLVQTSNAGRGLVASQDLQKGQVILMEKPLIVGPPQSVGPHFCINCSQPLTVGVLQDFDYNISSSIDCPLGCNLKICSEICNKSKRRHSAEECEMVKKIQDTQPHQWLTVLRVLMLKKNQSELWTSLNHLEHHLEERIDCPIMISNKLQVCKILKHFAPNLVDGLSEEDILKICGILDSNSFRIDKHGSRGLFLATSMINHDCVPNARIVFDQEGHLNLKAKKPISQGESITITYVPALLNTPARLSKLKNSKFFICKCQLCCDPTENGTFMSALVCPKCQGSLLPQSFHENNPKWTCNNCPFLSMDEKVQKLVETLRKNYLDISANPRITTQEKIPQLESILKKRSGTSLPATHQILIDLKSDLARLYDISPNPSNLQKRFEFVEERIDLIDRIEGPETETRLKGFMLFRLHNLVVEKFTILQRKNKITEKDMKEFGLKLGWSLQESINILINDQGCPKQLIQSMSSICQN